MSKNNDKRLEKINEKIQGWFDYWADNIDSYQANVAFNQGAQWDPDEITYYEQNNKARITNNLLNKYTKQIVGEQLKTTPEMQVVVDVDQVDQKKVALRNDLLRTIQIKNNSKECYEAGFESSLMGGYGALYFFNDYEEGMTFNQEVKQNPIKEPTLCLWDPKANDKTKADGDYCGVISFMRREEFEKKYPGAVWNGENWSTNVVDPGFFTIEAGDDNELVAICDFYEKRPVRKKIVRIAPTISGQPEEIIEKSKFDEYVAQYVASKAEMNAMFGFPEDTPIELPEILDERTAEDYKIKCYRLTKNEILEVYDFPSKHLPVIYVDGYSFTVNGKQIVKSFTQDAHDAQKMINYFWSEIAQHVRTYRRETVYGTDKMFEGVLNQMKNPEKQYAYVGLKPDAQFNGGSPIFREAMPFPPALIQAVEAAKQALLDVLGRSEASMGDQGNEVSGVAIANRMMQQNTVVNKYFDGLLKAIEQAGKLVNDLINNLYDQPRSMLLHKEDNKAYQVDLNKFNPETSEVENEISDEDFAIRISVGANYEMQRQEERAYLVDLLNQSQNPAFSKVADLMASLSDTPIKPKVVERFKTMVDPAIIAKEDGLPPPPPPPPPPQLMLEQQKLQNQAQESQVKQLQSQVDLLKAKMQFVESMADAQAKGVQANAEVQRAQLEFSKDIAQTHLDKIGHGVQALGHIKDLAAMMQTPDQGTEAAPQEA